MISSIAIKSQWYPSHSKTLDYFHALTAEASSRGWEGVEQFHSHKISQATIGSKYSKKETVQPESPPVITQCYTSENDE